jgi:hypothetical protein
MMRDTRSNQLYSSPSQPRCHAQSNAMVDSFSHGVPVEGYDQVEVDEAGDDESINARASRDVAVLIREAGDKLGD